MTLYTLGLAVIVAAVLLTARDLQTSVAEKQNILDDLIVRHQHLQNTHDKHLAEAGQTEAKLRDDVAQLGVSLHKAEDELEVCNKNYQHHMTSLQQELTDIKTKMFDREHQVNDLNAKNSELSGQLITVQRKTDDLKSLSDKLSTEKTELTAVVTGLHQDKHNLDSEIQNLKSSIVEKERSLELTMEDIENLKKSHLADVDVLKSEHMLSLANLEQQINSRQELINSRDEQIVALQNEFSQQGNVLQENNIKLREFEQSSNENVRMIEDLRKTLAAQQEQLDVKDTESELAKKSHIEEINLLNSKLAEGEKSLMETIKISEDLRQSVAAKQQELTEKEKELKLKDSEAEISLKKSDQKLEELTKLLTEQEGLNKASAQAENNLKNKLEELGEELEKTRKDAGECLVMKNEEETLLKEQIRSLRLEKETAEQKLTEIDMKLNECKTK